MIERLLRLPVTVTVIVALVLIFGVLSFFRIPRELTPNVDQPVVTVTTRWFGASPQEVVREIIEEQEDVLKTVEGLKEMSSEASEGEGSIRLQFRTGVDKQEAMNEVRDKIRQVPDYPEDVDEPVVEATDRFSRDYIAWILIRPIPDHETKGVPAPGFEHGDITKLGTFVEDYVKPVLERAEGVSEVNVLGSRESEMQVRVDLGKLASRGIPIDQLTGALRDANLDVTAGTVEQGKRSTSVRVVGQYTSPEEIENTVIAYTDAGAPVYVRDVADAVRDFKKESLFVRSKGIPTVAINVQRETGTNVLEVMANLKLAIAEVNEKVLGPTNWGIELQQVYDQSEYVDEAMNQAGQNLAIGAALAGIVLFVTLRSFGATMVVMLAIPICVVGTFLGMAVFGRSLNVISLSGLTFAIGMGIDNAIVVLENIFRHREMGKDRFRAAVDGTKEVWGAIVAATLTNVAVFLPMVFIQEEAGQLFRDISIALTISFFFYLFVAPTVIPLLTTIFLRRMPASFRSDGGAAGGKQTVLGRVTRPIGQIGQKFSDLFYAIILWLTGGFLRRVVLVVVFVGVSVFFSWKLIPPLDYLPTGNQNLIFGFILTPPGYNPDEYRVIANRAENFLRPWWEVAVKENDPPEVVAAKTEQLAQMQAEWRQMMDTKVIPGMEQQLAGKRAMLAQQNKTREEIKQETAVEEQMLRRMKESPPPQAIENFFFGMFGTTGFMGVASANDDIVRPQEFLMQGSIQGHPGTMGFFQQSPIFRINRSGAGLELSVQGFNNDEVRATSGAVMGALMEAFDTFPRPEPMNFHLGRNETQVEPDRVRAAEKAVSLPTIRQMTSVAVDGSIIGDYRDPQIGTIDLTVVSNVPRDARATEDLANIPLAAREGRPVTLGEVATLVPTSSPQQIVRISEMPAVSFNVQLPPGMTVQEATRVVREKVEEPLRAAGVIPPTIRLAMEGSADKLEEFMRSFIPGFALAAIITYLLLASLFENFLYPLVIILSVPFALVGGFLGLAVLHWYDPQYVLDVLTMLGFVILIGTIINNPILIVHQALNFMAEGKDRQHAIAESTQTRVRPIFMSVITSVAGMAPLVIFGGAGSELYRGLGAVLIAGLVVSTFFTLFLTPTLMSLALDASALTKRLFGGQKAEPAPRPALAVETSHETNGEPVESSR